MFNHKSRQRIRALWPGTRRPSSTTDDIPPPANPYPTFSLPPLIRHVTEPASIASHIPLLSVFSSASDAPPNPIMTSNATIVFSQPGLRPPVYVTTSLSAWSILEMDVETTEAASEHLLFKKEFVGVAEGSYQYKIRIGEEHWVLDHSTESAPDEQGNLNNVVQAKPSATPDPVNQKNSQPLVSDRKDSAMTTDVSNHLPDVAIPFVVSEATENPSHDNLKPVTITSDASKRATNADPDHEKIKADSPVQPSSPKSPKIPSLVENLDSKPDHRGQLGKDASTDKLMLSPEPSISATDKTHLARELSNETPMNRETGIASDKTSRENADELNLAPLLSHETGISGESGSLSDEDELNKAPLLSHETGFWHHKGSEVVTDSEFGEEEETIEPQHYGPFDDEDVPLLPHERESAIVNKIDHVGDEEFTLHGQPTFRYEDDSSQRLFGGNSRLNYFRSRTDSSTLPHTLPQTDEDDTNLDDPSLEIFPTSRDQILERVKTIGLQLPEDESIDDHVHSPQFSVLSQACSSVDLAPVKSYTSLASVPEADYDEEDVKSSASPIEIATTSTRMSKKPLNATSNALESPTVNSSKPLHSREPSKPEVESARTAMSSETDSVAKHDGTKEPSAITGTLQGASSLSSGTPDSPETTLDSGLRERRKVTEPETENESYSQDGQHDRGPDNGTVLPTPAFAPAQHPTQTNDSLFQTLIRVVLGPVGWFLSACAGDRKKASVSALVVGSAVAAALFIAFGP